MWLTPALCPVAGRKASGRHPPGWFVIPDPGTVTHRLPAPSAAT
jgi:hypothetical protein